MFSSIKHLVIRNAVKTGNIIAQGISSVAIIDATLGCHTHRIYGQGNFFFDDMSFDVSYLFLISK